MSEKKVEAWASAQLREKLENTKRGDLEVLKDAGLIDQDVIDFLIEFEEYYEQEENEAYYAHNTDTWNRIVKKNASKNLQKAIRQGDIDTVNHFLGVVDQETDVSGIQVYERFSRWIIRTAGITYLAGHMGSGKTDLALLIAEIFLTRLETSGQDVKIATNIRSCAEEVEEIDYIDNQPDLMEWIQADNKYKLFVFDEGSSHASGYSEDASKVTKQFRSMINLIRKFNGSMVIIGHSGKDIHPHIRRLCDYVYKRDKKDAAVFETVKEAEGKDKKFDLSKIPKTSLPYDTKESSSWEWATDEGKNLVQIACETYIASNMTQQEVADIFDISAAKISQNYERFTESSN